MKQQTKQNDDVEPRWRGERIAAALTQHTRWCKGRRVLPQRSCSHRRAQLQHWRRRFYLDSEASHNDEVKSVLRVISLLNKNILTDLLSYAYGKYAQPPPPPPSPPLSPLRASTTSSIPPEPLACATTPQTHRCRNASSRCRATFLQRSSREDNSLVSPLLQARHDRRELIRCTIDALRPLFPMGHRGRAVCVAASSAPSSSRCKAAASSSL